MRQRIFRLLLSASFERSSFSRIQPGFAFSKNCDVLEYMENFSGIGPGGHKPKNDSRTAKTPTAPEPAGHEEDGNSRGIQEEIQAQRGQQGRNFCGGKTVRPPPRSPKRLAGKATPSGRSSARMLRRRWGPASSPLRMRTASGFTGSFPRTTVETTASRVDN